VLVECVPNFSEGRRLEVVRALEQAIASVEGVAVLDTHWDPDYHRCVITFAGEPQAVARAAFLGVAEAVRRIDLREHRGSHPRIGAADVVPLVPLRGITLAELVPIARALGERIWRELGVPVFLYGEAASSPERRELSFVRRGNFEGLPRAMQDNPSRWPDFGPPRVHPTAGATAVGVRPPLIAYNVDLDTHDLEIARAVARRVRESGGGLPGVRAIGVKLASGHTQVSMNLLDYRTTPLHRVLERVKEEAERLGARVTGSEIVGLVPEEALCQCAEHYLGLRAFGPGKVLERRLAEVAWGRCPAGARTGASGCGS